ncbi:hypothetical protein [Fictibacillus phosphorivorans]|uniref:hypothetical protein n=1 Tax=Fictibacillus phosphorivorans TaxID=1221500 RepID=UPI0020416017|nr:hypothetical protein [Fictibacillus phosphorivorans]MCM3718120.1 hypothetical protein [Fictibacillus phosphorivorans]MCM3775747.1 hypothetical protein [Fictibacillus phosphorivorans]
MSAIKSSWVNFLRQYGPIPQNDNMYDETIQSILRKKKVTPIRIDMEYLDELVENFKSVNPYSVILTGTAGDGKTYYCREIWKRLGGSEVKWAENNKIEELVVNDYKVIFIKDLSELLEDEREILSTMADSIMGVENRTVFLVAANDGQLLETWKMVNQTYNVIDTKKCIEDLLVEGKKEQIGYLIKLYNLSKTNSANLLPKIIKEVLNNPGWEECNNCPLNNSNETLCPIIENKKRLEEENSLITKRLVDLLTLCEINEIHMPLRQLLLLVSNMLLGHPDVRDKLLKCSDISKINENNTTYLASIYRNIFGENLSERKRNSTDIFVTLNKFGIGSETNTLVDNILIFGEDDQEYYELYEQLVLLDQQYGADKVFISEKKAYLEGDVEDKDNFLEMLKSQRQRLFFVIPEKLVDRLNLWNLTTFQYAGEFLDQVYRVLKENQRVKPQYLTRLVRGLNRITTGLLVQNNDQLILSTSGNYSQAKISRVLEEMVSVSPKRGEYIKFDMGEDKQRLNLTVSFASDLEPVRLNLQLVRYEFISRVAEGALPGSFSRECYEDILAFKSRLLKKLDDRRLADGELEEAQISLKLLKVNDKGIVEHKTLEVF